MNTPSMDIFNELIHTYIAPEETVKSISMMPSSGSHRRYYRILLSNGKTYMGVYNEDVRENEAFYYFTSFFFHKRQKVPQLIGIHEDRQHYLLSDLGDITLYQLLTFEREGKLLGDKVTRYYKKVLEELPKWQLSAQQKMNFNYCYPREAFDRLSIQWDLNYFKYYFLKLAGIEFDEQLLEDDFQRFADFLLEADANYFLYRDFQSRNIMIQGDDLYFIDYQGGRKGPLQYDIASLLYDAKADIAPKEREELLQYYLQQISLHIKIDTKKFLHYFDSFALVRILQALGTYGYRGYYEKKSHFLQSIPFALENIRYLLEKHQLPATVPYLTSILEKIIQVKKLQKKEFKDNQLTVVINSFAYKNGIPADFSPHSGGFVFDCRALPNPGRVAELRNFTGKDEIIIQWISQYPQFKEFMKNSEALLKASIDNYLERKFASLMVNFGCTGGQHRSVYCAEKMATALNKCYPDVHFVIYHRELE
ncbi:MAG: phosphotransferase [Bacteroidales bacterium]|jgi:aminoglycoside/choline kinase family phosphotransferase|nr:phosphotransferase [Bacteroidales bacterium]